VLSIGEGIFATISRPTQDDFLATLAKVSAHELTQASFITQIHASIHSVCSKSHTKKKSTNRLPQEMTARQACRQRHPVGMMKGD
jgi:hypothetical protein